MKQKFCKKLLLIVTAVMMLCSALPLQTFTQVSAASDYEIVTLPAPDGYGQKSRTQISKNGKIAGGLWYIIAHNGDIAYCLEPGKPINSFKYKEGTISLTQNQKKLLGQVFLYAYAKKPADLYSYSEYLPQYIATQLLVWEVIAGQRDAQFNRISNGYTPVKDVLNNFKNAEVCKQVKNFYESYEKNIKTGSKEISFAYKKDSLAKENALKCGSDGTYTFTDKNGQLNNFDVTVKDGSVVSKSATQLKIKAEANKTALITMKQNNVNASGERCGMLVLTNGSNNQTITKLQADPRDYYAAVKGVENGSLWIKKSSPDDNKVEGITFHITGNGIDGDYTTGKDGYIRIPGLKPGTYKVSEKTSSIYTNVRDKTVIVEAGKTAYVLFVNTLKKGHLVVTKYTEDKAEANFTFGLYSTTSDGKVYDTFDDKITTYIQGSGYGIASWTELPFWTEDGKELIYVLTEKNAPDRYVTLGEFEGSLLSSADDNGLMIHLDVENKLKRSSVLIVKKDSESGDNIPLPGTEFQILDSNGNKVILTDDDGNETDTFVTDESGQILLPEPLVYGTYQLIETKAPDGYALDKTPIDFAITEDGATVQVEKMNTPQKGTITISKIGDVFSSVESEENSSAESEKNKKIYSPVFEENSLKGAKFDIIAAEDIYTPDGNLKVEKDTVVDTITTGSDGTATSKKLYLGTYRVVEIEAPEGYVLENGETLVTLEYEGQEIAVTNTGTSFKNNYQQVNITLEKYLESSEKYGINGEDYAQYVKFGLYAAEEITAADGTVIPENGLIETIGLTEDMKAQFNKKLPLGSYYVQEITTDEHYILDDTKYPVNFEYLGQDTAVSEIKINDGKVIDNTFKTGRVEGLKVDADDKSKLSGAVIGLFNADETDFSEENAIETVVSDDDGSFNFEEIIFGNYLVKEIESPTGYVLSDETFPIVISEDGDVIEITIKNEKIRGSVQVKKYDLTNKSKALNGAVFEIFADKNGNEKFENDTDKSYGFLNEIGDGIYQLDGVEYGGYFLKETVAPAGYVIDENYYYFEIRENGEIVNVSNDKSSDKFFNDVIRGNVNGLKINADDKTELQGAVIGLFNADETDFSEENAIETVTSDKDGSFKFTDIVYGKYKVAEIEAPEGFVLSENVYDVNINVNGVTIEITIRNKPIKGNVLIAKYDSGNPPQILNGAVFAVYRDVNGDKKFTNGTDELLGNMTESSAGIHEYKDLLYGDYLTREIKAPEGYTVDRNYYAFSIKKDGETVKVGNNADGNFYNKDIKGNIEGVKVGESDEPLSGAVIGLFSDGESEFTAENALAAVTTEKDGKFIFKDIVYGKYIVAEIQSPTGYILTEETFPVSISKNNEVITVKISNEKIRGNIEGIKIGESDEPLAGAVIGLFADGESDFSADKAVKSVTTDENGKFAFEDIEYGKYIVAEIQSPEGYVLTSETFPVSIEENGQVITVKIHNEKIRGTIEGVKVGKSDEPLAGAVIGLFANGESEFTAENALAAVTTEKDGKFIFKDIVYGKYIVAEIQSPTGYILTEETFPVSISKNNEVITVKISNEKIRGNIEGIKIGESDEPLAGAVIGLFADGESDFSADKAVKSVTTDENGKFAFEDIEYGKYIVAEIQSPEGYVLTSETFPVSIEENGQVITVKIHNEKIRGTIEGVKVGKSDEPLAGAVIGLFANGESEFTAENALASVTTEKDGRFIFKDIEYGKYIVAEIESPEGYILTEKTFPVSVSTDNEVITVKISNEKIKGNIEGIKVGESDEPLSGAVIGLFADGESDLTNRNALGTVTTDENGKFVFENVEYGKYIIAEIQPPEGYILTNQIYPVEISQNTQISITIVNVKIKGIVEIEKYDSLTDEKLSGAEFTVFTDTNGNGKFDEGEQYGVLEEVETGLYRLENIPYGSYFLKETKSPDGYYIDDNYYNFKIENNGEVVKITNNDSSDKFVNQKITTTTTTTVTTTTTFTSGTVPYVTYNNPSPLTGSKKIPAAVFITGLTAFGGMLLFKHKKQNKK